MSVSGGSIQGGNTSTSTPTKKNYVSFGASSFGTIVESIEDTLSRSATLENEDEDRTDIKDLIPSAIHFLWKNFQSNLLMVYYDWTIVFRHPFDSLFTFCFAPFIAITFVIAAFFMWLLLPQGESGEFMQMILGLCNLSEMLKDKRLKESVVTGLKHMEKEKALEFDIDVARSLLLFSSVIYHEAKKRQEFLDPLNEYMQITYSSVTDVHVGHICGIFVTNSHEDIPDQPEPINVIVSFRGTSPLNANQWLVDSTFNKADAHEYLYGACHEGFYQVLFELDTGGKQVTYWDIIDEIKKQAPADPKKAYRLWVTGHSLGGAFASLFYARIRDAQDLPEHIQICGAYTFGAPRVGNLEFRNGYANNTYKPNRDKAKMFRVQNANDPVPHIPIGNDDPNTVAMSSGPSGLDLMNYCHIGEPVLIHYYDTTWIPDQYPKHTVGNWADLAQYSVNSILVWLGVASITDWVIGWRDVHRQFQEYLNPNKTHSTLNEFLFFLTYIPLQTICMSNHVTIGYLRNLDVYENTLKLRSIERK